jgi:murein DD-endopeptidase MepM/ murein hydrolase activator NlpD
VFDGVVRYVALIVLGLAAVVGLRAPGGAGEAAARRRPDLADGFDYPVGAPDARGYYDAQPYGENAHLGADWNGTGGGDTDLGDPVFAVARGKVVEVADHGGGWGTVVRVVHRVRDARGGVRELESLYAHLDTVEVRAGAAVERGARLGTIGTAGGRYPAHLHFELRAAPGLPLGGGYGEPAGHVDPSAFIRAHRPR